MAGKLTPKRERMATTEQAAPAPALSGADAPESLAEWLARNQKLLLLAGAGLLLAGLAAWFVTVSGQRKELFASQQLGGARSIAEAGDLPRAAGEFQRIAEGFRGTDAAQEAVISLNQVRLISGQQELAVVGLQEFIASGPDEKFVAPASGLLGAALENTGKAADAAAAYERASEAATTDYLKADYLTQAARAWMGAGQQDKAIATYQRVVDSYGTTPFATEAKVRLAEIAASVK
jgi:TolA-binding protein